jgi:putative ribosome biogenesis GTPase RsgA
MNKNVIIIRGVSGAGKSTFANLVSEPKVVCCADDYFTDVDGNYNFDVSKLGVAHNKCLNKFMHALSDPSVENIVIANTNTKASDWEDYEVPARAWGASVFFIVLENRHGNKDVHNVPEETLMRQEQNVRSSLKLR